VTSFDIAVYFTNTHKDLASWVPKVKKEKKKPVKLPKTPRIIGERPVVQRSEKVISPKVKPLPTERKQKNTKPVATKVS